MNWKNWLHGFGAAVIGGSATAAGGALGAMAAGVDVFAPLFWKIVAGAAIFGGITNAAAYLKQSPLPSSGAAPTTAKQTAAPLTAQSVDQRPPE
ncbi:MAG TPA: hypothetical protein VN428_02295 [Bryobacteraceae bacterium]|nr:hypothetical protein [Bryobacteraceae bacterium]